MAFAEHDSLKKKKSYQIFKRSLQENNELLIRHTPRQFVVRLSAFVACRNLK